jgi:hypothetical protein
MNKSHSNAGLSLDPHEISAQILWPLRLVASLRGSSTSNLKLITMPSDIGHSQRIQTVSIYKVRSQAILGSRNSHAELAEIAQRLEHSFDAPFTFEGYVLHGSASVGFALYPRDGATKDSLLSAADAAMYVVKQTESLRIESRLTVPSGDNA